LAGASLWIILATLFIYIVAWTTDQFLLYEDTPLPWFAWPLISWGHALALAVPVALLAYFTRAPRLRAGYQAWLVAVLFVFVLALARVFPITQTQPAAVAQIVLTLLSIALLWLLARARHLDTRLALRFSPLLLALGLASIRCSTCSRRYALVCSPDCSWTGFSSGRSQRVRSPPDVPFCSMAGLRPSRS
jgi:hypothetical protein